MIPGVTNHDGELDAETLEEARRLARSRPKSGRGQLAKAAAIRTLERVDRHGGRRTPPMPEGWRGPPNSRFADLDLAAPPPSRKRLEEWFRWLWSTGKVDSEGWLIRD
jgi:hypothetical protein